MTFINVLVGPGPQARCVTCRVDMVKVAESVDQLDTQPARALVTYECPKCFVMVEVTR